MAQNNHITTLFQDMVKSVDVSALGWSSNLEQSMLAALAAGNYGNLTISILRLEDEIHMVANYVKPSGDCLPVRISSTYQIPTPPHVMLMNGRSYSRTLLLEETLKTVFARVVNTVNILNSDWKSWCVDHVKNDMDVYLSGLIESGVLLTYESTVSRIGQSKMSITLQYEVVTNPDAIELTIVSSLSTPRSIIDRVLNA